MNTDPQLGRLGLFDARVPRYTSYPPANHFKNAPWSEPASQWLSTLDPAQPVSLYVHVPFCRRLCWFCACRTQGTSTLAPVAAYVETLKTELALIKARLPKGITIGHLHWGGGTPTLLSPEMMTDLTDAIFATAPLAPGAEFSVEIDPNEIDADRIAALAAAGMTRASIGVQDFDPAIQEAIGRPQSFEITREAVDMLRAAGIQSLNTDILYGLPMQTNQKITESVEKLLSLNPDRVALFGYAHVPWMAKRQVMIPTDELPGAEARLNLFNTARDLFRASGFDDIGIDHFAKPTDSMAKSARAGTLRRNFQGYTTDTQPTLIGIGASSSSRFKQGFAQNAPATGAYQKHIRAGNLAHTRGHEMTSEDLIRWALIERLMCDFAVDFAPIARDYGLSAAQWQGFCDVLDADFPNLLDISPDRIAIPEVARPLTRMIARRFDAYEMAAGTHSSAV